MTMCDKLLHCATDLRQAKCRETHAFWCNVFICNVYHFTQFFEKVMGHVGQLGHLGHVGQAGQLSERRRAACVPTENSWDIGTAGQTRE